MTVRSYWLVRYSAQLPSHDRWLTAGERRQLHKLRTPERRRDWRLGRWTAKQALTGCPDVRVEPERFGELEVRSDRNGAPQAWLRDAKLPVVVSLSHRRGAALCALSNARAVGCDLELVEERGRAFLEDCFTVSEQARLVSAGDRREVLANGMWSAKESILKLRGAGFRCDPRLTRVELCWPSGAETSRWLRFRARQNGEPEAYRGWWRKHAAWVLTLVTEPVTATPIWLGALGSE